MKQLIVATLALELFVLSAARVAAQGPAAAPPPAPPPAPAAQPAPPPAPPPPPPAQPTYYTPPPPAPPAASSHGGTGDIRDNTIDERPMALSIMGWLPWYRGFGFGGMGRFEIPIVHNGFISALNNHISIEPSFGIAYTTWDYGLVDDAHYINFLPALYGSWSFHFSYEFRVYAAVGLGYNIGTVSDDDRTLRSGSHFFYDFAVGLFYDLSEAFALRAEVGYGGAKGGVAILF